MRPLFGCTSSLSLALGLWNNALVQAYSYVWHLTGGDLQSTRFTDDTILDLKCRDGLLVVHSIRLFQ